jgi:hypothetical protein
MRRVSTLTALVLVVTALELPARAADWTSRGGS